MNELLREVGLTAADVRRMCHTPERKPCAPRTKAVGVPRRKVGEGVNLDKIRAWLEMSKPGDEVSRQVLVIPAGSATAAFRRFVKTGELRQVRGGKHGQPVVFAKV